MQSSKYTTVHMCSKPRGEKKIGLKGLQVFLKVSYKLTKRAASEVGLQIIMTMRQELKSR